MALVQMPNGEYVDVDENISDEALSRIKSEYKPTRQNRGQGAPRKTLTEHDRKVQQRADEYRNSGWNNIPGYSWIQQHVSRPLGHGIMFGADNAIRGGISAAMNAAGNVVGLGNGNNIGEEYRVARDADAMLNRDYAAEAPITAAGSEIGGALLNPVGMGGKVLTTGANVARGAGSVRTAAGLERASQMLSGPISSAIVAGGKQGALNATGNAISEGADWSALPDRAMMGGGIGAVAGGALGGALHLGARGTQIIRDALPGNAERTAFSRIAELLENGKMTPAQAQREIAVTDARGGDAMVQDLTPGLRAMAGGISRKPSVPSSNELIERGADRITQRGGKFTDQVRTDANLPAAGDDALARAEQLAGTRRAAGERDYAEGGAMDEIQFSPSKKIDDWFNTSPDADRLARRAYDAALREGRDPAKLFKQVNETTGEVSLKAVPTFRAFDYIKRQFDDEIGAALQGGQRQLARGLSNHLNQLKGMLGEANPQYAAILKTQRDLFQQEAALETGTKVLGRLSREPRQVLADLKKLGKDESEEARIGIIDALVNLDNKADPVAFFRSVSRNDAQRKVLEFAFGGTKEFRRFQRWVDREVRSTRADALTAPGRQSETSRLQMAAIDADHGGAGDVIMNAARGWAFGGPVGGASAIVRTLNNIATGTSKFAQEEIAKILLSKGDDLVKGVDAVKSYRKLREASNRRRAVMGGKAGQQVYSSAAGSS